MATPAYTHFDPASPDPSAQNGDGCFDGSRNNFFALAMAVIMGYLPGWNLTVTPGTGTYIEPQYHVHSNGVYRLRMTFTRNGNSQVTQILYEWSNDSGATYATAKTQTITYDGTTGAVTGYTGA